MTNKQALRDAAEKHGDDDILALLDELEAAEKRVADMDAREVELPRPACTYADHSYPAYSERQVVALLESLGIRINGED